MKQAALGSSMMLLAFAAFALARNEAPTPPREPERPVAASPAIAAPDQGTASELDLPEFLATPRSPSHPRTRRIPVVGKPADMSETTQARNSTLEADHQPPGPGRFPISSSNIELVANVPVRGAFIFGPPGGRFRQVSTASGSRTYFYVTGMFNGLTVLDATNAAAPAVVAELPLPHWENEDVDMAGNTLLISVDGAAGSFLYVIDISAPEAPRLRGTYSWGGGIAGFGSSGPGHIANCIADCRFAWVTGASDGSVAILDLGDPSQPMVTPTSAGKFFPAAGRPNANPDATAFTQRGTVHDVNVDPSGIAWVTGSGGLSGYTFGAYGTAGSPRAPVHIGSNPASGLNTFILHNSLSPDSLVYVGEENYSHPDNDCYQAGRFEIYDPSGGQIRNIASWSLTPRTGLISLSGTPQYLCSNHWFDYSPGQVIMGKYQQGVSLLDVSDPFAVKETAWWIAPDTIASAAYFHPADPSFVYTADYNRGVDVLHLCDGDCPLGGGLGPGITLGSSARIVTFQESEAWGLVCPRPK